MLNGTEDLAGKQLLCSGGLVSGRGRFGRCFCFGNVIKNALAGIADYDLLVGANVVIHLRAKHYLASGTLVVAGLGERGFP